METFILVDGARPTPQEIYEELEGPNWAPWLQFRSDQLAGQVGVFPDGQLVLGGPEGKPVGMLSSNRIDWNGQIDSLPSWDDVAGPGQTFEDTYNPSGNTQVLMSMSARRGAGRGLSMNVFKGVKEYARANNLEHIIGDFRPSDFGTHKRETGNVDFADYCIATREDGLPQDRWLRTVSRQGAEFLKFDRRAMVVPSSFDEVSQWSLEYKPDQWWEVTEPEQIERLLSWHEPLRDLEQVDQIWECGETGTWYIDTKNNKAVYIESNLWGELSTDDEHQTPENEKYRYNLTEEEYRRLESEMVEGVKLWHPEPDVYGVWVAPDHPFANTVRTMEARHFREIPGLVDDQTEQASLFYALVDTRNGEDRIVHGARLSGVGIMSGETDPHINRAPGFIVINELIRNGEISEGDFKAYCKEEAISPERSFSVETNFRVGAKVPDRDGIRTADIVYMNFSRILMSNESEPDGSAIFASINRASRISFARTGINFAEIPTRLNAERGEPKYTLVAIPYNPAINPAMRQLVSSVGNSAVVKQLKFT